LAIIGRVGCVGDKRSLENTELKALYWNRDSLE